MFLVIDHHSVDLACETTAKEYCTDIIFSGKIDDVARNIGAPKLSQRFATLITPLAARRRAELTADVTYRLKPEAYKIRRK
ncbi:MAG: hypothetical protein R3C28_30805 [Pirellulaceae bacterium]